MWALLFPGPRAFLFPGLSWTLVWCAPSCCFWLPLCGARRALCFLKLFGPARHEGPAGWKQASERSWKLLLAGSPDDCAGLARPSLEVLYFGKVPWSFVVAFLLEQHAAADGASQTLP